MKKWLKKVIIGDDFYHVFNDISMLDHEVKNLHIGYYDTPEKGSKAYKEAVLKYRGTFLDKCKVVNG